MRLALSIAFFLCLTFLMPGPVLAFPQGGSQAIVCRDDQNQITSVENLDLYFAQVVAGARLIEFDGSVEYVDVALKVAQNVGRGGGGLNPTVIHTDRSRGRLVSSDFNVMESDEEEFQQHFEASISDINDKKTLLESGYRLKLKNPEANFDLEPGCKREQLAAFDPDKSQLRIVSDYWQHLDARGKAAVLVHEALQRNLHFNLVEDLVGPGQAVAYAFSEGSEFEWLMDGIPTNSLKCWSTDDEMAYRFFAYPESDESVTLQFLMLEGKLPLTKTFLRVARKLSPLARPENIVAERAYAHLESAFSRGAQVALSVAVDKKGKPILKMQLDQGDLPKELKYSIDCDPFGRNFNFPEPRSLYQNN